METIEDSDGKARLGRVNRDVVRVVWEAFSTFVEKQIEMNKAVNGLLYRSYQHIWQLFNYLM